MLQFLISSLEFSYRSLIYSLCILQALEVNLITTDYSMPGMTGYDLLRKIKESKSLKDIPIVIVSSENIPSRINRWGEKEKKKNINLLQVL